jgi:hypothetical protein
MVQSQYNDLIDRMGLRIELVVLSAFFFELGCLNPEFEIFESEIF